MSAPGIIELPDVDDGSTTSGSGYIVTVYDNDKNTFEEVILILMAATMCPFEEAEMETWEVHHLGKSVVHHGTQEDCTTVAAIISQIRIKVTVTQE